MVLYINTNGFSGGPKVFRKRLINGFNKYSDVLLVSDPKKYFDAEICFVNIKNKSHKKPCILRLDGCYYDKKRIKMNKSLKKSILLSSGIIFQSNFSKKMCNKFISTNIKKSCVIYNGIDFDEINEITPSTNVVPGSFVACAGWRSNKRPNSIVRGFLAAGISEHLYMIGDGIKNPIKHPNIHYLGNLSWRKIISIMKSCSYQIHLCHIDSCPNAVVEGLACGLNILCSNLGGTPEIVRSNGVIMDIDRWDFRPVDNMKFDNLKDDVVADGISRLKTITVRADRPDLHIKNIVKQYLDAILETIK
jgi:glycosyltransferase involved in cell wall biosynthesis